MNIEARRVINLIPRCIPGKVNNEPISIKYCLPITLKTEDKKIHYKKKHLGTKVIDVIIEI